MTTFLLVVLVIILTLIVIALCLSIAWAHWKNVDALELIKKTIHVPANRVK
jgi:hypothetical protein